MKRSLIMALLAASMAPGLQAHITLPAYLTSHMVLQQRDTLRIKGTSDQPQVTIRPSWTSKTYTTAGGNFMVAIPTPKAGGPYSITLNDGSTPLELTDVLVGEVWFCSGQSNMEMPVKGWGKVKNYEQELQQANYPSIRLLQSKRATALQPTDAAQVNGGGWRVCSGSTVENFSATAYFFARNLWQKLHVPIGVVDASWGGTPAEAWTSNTTLQHVAGFSDHAKQVAACGADRAKHDSLWAIDHAQWLKAYNAADAGMQGEKPRWTTGLQSGEGWMRINVPGNWEDQNLGLNNFDGIMWYQRAITIPDDWDGKDLKISLGKIDDDDVTYFNGQVIGQTRGYWIERSYTIPAHMVKRGINILTIRVNDNSGGGGLWGDASHYQLTLNGQHTLSLAGQWQCRVGCSLGNLPQSPRTPDNQNYISNLYNAMVHPYRHMAIAGVIWYQGEENAQRWPSYYELFPALIGDWRQLWQRPKMPFYFVQLANWQAQQPIQPNSTWAHIREAQAGALRLQGTGMACIIDIGEAADIHPKNKQEVGARLARIALARTYGKGTWMPPVITAVSFEGRHAVLTASKPLTVKGDSATGFAIAGPDMQFHPAQATVGGAAVTVTSPAVAMPIAVRYGWADNPPCNVFSADGLPLEPYRSDHYDNMKP